MRMRTRLTDNDKKLGPLVYGKTNGWKPFGVYFITSDSENPEVIDNHIRFWGFGWVANLYIPTRVKPNYEKKVYKEYSYDQHCPKRFGFFSTNDGINFYFGKYDFCESSKSKSTYIPYTFKEWRWVKTDMYDGNDVYQGEYSYKASKNIYKSKYIIIDFDGEEIIATTYKKVMHFKFGGKYFKWLSWFIKDKKHTSLDIEFSSEVGPEKGSWKGGTLGHGIDMKEGESQHDAFKRYCEQTHRSKYKTYKIEYKDEYRGDWNT